MRFNRWIQYPMRMKHPSSNYATYSSIVILYRQNVMESTILKTPKHRSL